MPTAKQLQKRYDALSEKFQERVDGLADRLIDGDLTEKRFEMEMRSLIADYYEDAYRYGAGISEGGFARLTAEDRAIINAEVKDEYAYLKGFYQDLKNGDLSDEMIAWRTGLYGDGLTSIYWGGRVSRIDGTQYEAWFISEEDERSCENCPLAADNSPYPPDEAPLPGSAVCDGFNLCRCSLEFRLIPEDRINTYETIAKPSLVKVRSLFRTFADMKAAIQS